MTNPHETETEDQLILRAQQALSRCNWVIGECAANWTQRYARGRTDVDFGVLIGLSGDQVYQRRRVWETFADVQGDYPQLKWSHFYVAVNWDDASECLQWANEMEATVAEMKAWRRAQRGEDLSEPANEEAPFTIHGDILGAGTGVVREPQDYEVAHAAGGGGTGEAFAAGERHPGVASAARDAGLPEYAPFGKGARGDASDSEQSSSEPKSAEQIVKRATSAIERAVASLTPEILEEFHDLPISLQQRFLEAVDNLQSRTGGLS